MLWGFCMNALTTALSTGLVPGWRAADPLGTFASGRGKRFDGVLQTCAVTFVSTLSVLVLLYLCVAYDGSALIVNVL